MPTQTSQLVTNLQAIYNEKLLIKQAIPTTSDNFSDYHTYIAALHPSGTSYISTNGLSDVSSYQFAYVTVEGGGSGNDMNPFYAEYVDGDIISAGTDVVEGTNGNLMIESDLEFYYEGGPVTEGCQDIDTIEFNTTLYDPYDDSITYPAHVILTGEEGNEAINVLLDLWFDNEDYQEDLYGNITITVKSWTATESEDPSEDGYDYLIECQGLNYINAMENNSNVEEITENGFFVNNTCAIGFNINVSGGSGSSADPLYGCVSVNNMIENEETTADYVQSVIYENFEYVEDNGEYTISWDDHGDVIEEGQPIRKIFHVVLTGDPHEIYGIGSDIASDIEDYPSLYTNIYPILENATLTESSDPSEDGYDYLLEGDLYAWNLNDNYGQVNEIIGNGFHANEGRLGFVIP